MSDFTMTLADAIIVRDHLRRLGYPNSWDLELLTIAENQIFKARADALLRWRAHKLDNPPEGPSKTKLPASPDDGGDPIFHHPV